MRKQEKYCYKDIEEKINKTLPSDHLMFFLTEMLSFFLYKEMFVFSVITAYESSKTSKWMSFTIF